MDTENMKTELLISTCDLTDTIDINSGPKYLSHSEKITFTWNNINVFVKEGSKSKRRFLDFNGPRSTPSDEGKQILKNVNGIARPGELLAIMGSSGAGKTTLMNVLTSQFSSNMIISGFCCANGVPFDSHTLRSKLAYIQQEDIFIGTLTVKEHLVFQALLRMDKHITYSERMQRVEEVVRELGLTKCENTKIGIQGRIKGISGGEMKRLAFASEVITNPSIMFCDEPTSGLDSFMALNIVQSLRELAQFGKTIICTIHQPSSELYTMFDKILLVAEGRVAFLGTRKEAETFFASLDAPCPSNYNPADYFLELLAITPGREEYCRQVVYMICDKFAESHFGEKLALETAVVEEEEDKFAYVSSVKPKSVRYKASWCTQLRVLLWRTWLSDIRDPLSIRAKVFQTLITELIIILIFYGQSLTKDGVMNITGAIYLLLINLALQNLVNAGNAFCERLPIFMREYTNGMYRADVYFLSKNVTDLPIYIIMPVVVICICYYLIGFNPDVSNFFIAIGITILVVNTSVSFGYLISCLCDSVDMVISVEISVIIPLTLFAGYLINIDAIPKYLRWLSYVSWLRYGFEGLMVNQWSGINYINCTGTAACPSNGMAVLNSYHLHEENLVLDVILIVVLLCLYRLLAYFALLAKSSTFK
ncbi:hypothetical protein RI129_006728 [Pyrocoelia pectoralis]|uniref:Protein white n=1 Tax=Pyrocoelia pectoralis TaxID=417401 RepID=A0AAN7ZP64_9COLE